MTNVLIAVDGSELDRRVAQRALHLFGPDSSYVVVNVSEDAVRLTTVPIAHGFASAMSTPELTRLVDGIDGQAESAEGVAEQAVEDAGINATAIGEVGDPPTVILSAAAEHNADVIVVGTHDRNWVARLFDPSVSQAVTHRSDVPVLVVHGRDV